MTSLPSLPARWIVSGRRWADLVAVLALATLAACDDDGGIAAFADPPRVTHVSVFDDGGPIFRSVEVELDRPGGVVVEYWTEDGAPRLRTGANDDRSRHELFLARLRAGRSYRFRAWAVSKRGLAGTPVPGTFTTDPLPEALREIRLVAVGTPTFPLTVVEAIVPDRPLYPFVVDDQGQIVWYRPTEERSEGFTRLDDLTFVFNTAEGLQVVTPRNEVVARLDRREAAAETGVDPFRIHHDVVTTPENTVLMLVQDPRSVGDTVWTGEAIWEWDPAAGSLDKRWSSADFFDPRVDRGPRSVPGDWLHANSLSLGPRGNVLVSAFWLHEVFSIAPSFDALEWRLGGPSSSFAVENDAMEAGQHTAAEVAPGRVLMFDNGWDRSVGLFSRALEMELDEAAGVARIAWQFRPTPDIYAPAISSAVRLDNGNTVVGFGMAEGSFQEATGPIAVFEVTQAGRVLWKLEVLDGLTFVYRAMPISTLAGEVEVSGPRASISAGSVR